MINKKANLGTSIILFVAIIAVGYFTYSHISFPDTILNDTCSDSSCQVNVSNNTLPPGDILTNNLTIICVSGYSATVRDVPQKLREEVFARDNVSYPQPTGTTELDHIIPLCLGGSNDEKNLFVQFITPPGYKEKDKLENYLCDHVCSGEIDIDYAQQRIASDWYNYYIEVYGE